MSEATLSVEERFVLVPEWVLDHPGLSDRSVRLYLVLRSFADNVTGVAWPGRRRLAERLRCDVKTVDRALAELVKVGAVTVRARFDDDHGQRSNAYVVRHSRPGSTPLVTGDQGGGQPRPGLPPAVTRAPGQPCPPELEPGELEGGAPRDDRRRSPGAAVPPGDDLTHGGRHKPGNPEDRACGRCRDERAAAAVQAERDRKLRERDELLARQRSRPPLSAERAAADHASAAAAVRAAVAAARSAG